MFNIAMLKRVFAPTFILHDLRQTGEHEITTRWTMEVCESHHACMRACMMSWHPANVPSPLPLHQWRLWGSAVAPVKLKTCGDVFGLRHTAALQGLEDELGDVHV
jgi:hypothetical protein